MQQPELELVKNEEEDGDTACRISTTVLYLFPALSDRLLHLFDYVAILRPLLLIPVWTMLLLGYYKGPGVGMTHGPFILRPDSKILITIFLYSLLMGAVYILNQISDSHADEVNGKLYLVAQGYMKEKNLKIQIVILSLLSVIIALLRFPRTYVYLMLLSIVLGILYSVPPFRLKGRPLLDLLANAFGFGVVAFAVGWTATSAFSAKLILECLPYVICISAAFINTTIPDIKGDVQNGDITTGAFLGIRRSCILSTFLVSAVPLISLLLRDFVCLTASVLSLPFFVYMTVCNWNERSPRISAITLATKASLLILSLLVAVFIPFYFVLLIPTLLLMKVYYKMRFGISYP
jgi:chlorophyll synthase